MNRAFIADAPDLLDRVLLQLKADLDAEMEHRQQLQDELNVAWMDTKVERKRRERAESKSGLAYLASFLGVMGPLGARLRRTP